MGEGGNAFPLFLSLSGPKIANVEIKCHPVLIQYVVIHALPRPPTNLWIHPANIRIIKHCCLDSTAFVLAVDMQNHILRPGDNNLSVHTEQLTVHQDHIMLIVWLTTHN